MQYFFLFELSGLQDYLDHFALRLRQLDEWLFLKCAWFRALFLIDFFFWLILSGLRPFFLEFFFGLVLSRLLLFLEFFSGHFLSRLYLLLEFFIGLALSGLRPLFLFYPFLLCVPCILRFLNSLRSLRSLSVINSHILVLNCLNSRLL